MNLSKIINIKRLLVIFGLLFCFNHVLAQQPEHSKALAAADSSKFSPNKKDGWQLFNSYVATTSKDSATLELIIQHANNIDWKQEQYVGKVKDKSLQPGKPQTLPFNLLTDNYQLRIDAQGKCYVKFLNGSLPSSDPFILPLKVFYKL
jgi:hypothetical protein